MDLISSSVKLITLPLLSLLFLGLFSLHARPKNKLDDNSKAVLSEFCVDCHNNKKAKGKVNLEKLIASNAFDANFKTWDLVSQMLDEKEMPPEDEQQPSDAQRARLIAVITTELEHSKQALAGDPGPVVLRRLTSAEYNYAIQDLTGLNLNLDRLIGSDAVGGEGFSNVGEVQFVQDATVERYLEAAKNVASHALIGAGPLEFTSNPGMTGQELSAINRIQSIYRSHGFRTGAGEGAEAFGLEQYAKAFYVAWLYQHRATSETPGITLEELATREALFPSFAGHIWSVLNKSSSTFPTSEIIALWNDLPGPGTHPKTWRTAARVACNNLYKQLSGWQKSLAANTNDDEEAAVLVAGSFNPTLSHRFRVGISWPIGSKEASFDLSAIPSCINAEELPVVQWDQPQLGIRAPRGERRQGSFFQPLKKFLSSEQTTMLKFGEGLHGDAIDPESFITRGQQDIAIKFPVPPESSGGSFSVTVKLAIGNTDDCLVRCIVSDGLVPGETVASTGASTALLANPQSDSLDVWRTGIEDFAKQLPQVSHREPAPSDRDPIPLPYDNTYNTAERNSFHYVIKYHRDDEFLTNHLIDDSTRAQLDHAWTDLLTAFDYHETFYQFIATKYEFSNNERSLSDLNPRWMDTLPGEPRVHVKRLFNDYSQKQFALTTAEPAHLDDTIQFATQAWRRSLSTDEMDRLRYFYHSLRQESKFTHRNAVRALLTRILVSPSFLYRLEIGEPHDEFVDISESELASRLSFFLWSSIPDDHLQHLANDGSLKDPLQLKLQVEQMLRGPKARRFATEFFGQWFGFYQFNHYRGIDSERFPDFTDELKAALYDEAISFFGHIVQEDRPLKDLLFADYTFLNPLLANHYGIKLNNLPAKKLTRVENLETHHRGGLIQLGAILTATSAPLRTSPVKRGDWILRRILGTPVPPPPADAGSIPADDILADGLTVRARLEAHRQNPDCVNCHSRIDPLGFALEHFDPVGRWRDTYRDGQPIDDSGILSDGTGIDGLQGLRSYLKQNISIFQRNLVSKLLGYALGRSTNISDQTLIDELTESLSPESPFSELVFRIASSSQFQKKRGKQEPAPEGEIETTSLSPGFN